MIKLAQHIEYLLLNNDCVILPDFGGFITYYTAANYIDEEQLFIPPARHLGFNAQLKINDGLLVQSYMEAYALSYVAANKMVQCDIQCMRQELNEKGRVEFGHIGELKYTMDEVFMFVPYDNKFETPDFYGLESFEIKTLEEIAADRHRSKEEVLSASAKALTMVNGELETSKLHELEDEMCGADDNDEKQRTSVAVKNGERKRPQIHLKISRALLRNSVAALIVLLFFFNFSTPIEEVDFNQQNYAHFVPTELFGNSHGLLSQENQSQENLYPENVKSESVNRVDVNETKGDVEGIEAASTTNSIATSATRNNSIATSASSSTSTSSSFTATAVPTDSVRRVLSGKDAQVSHPIAVKEVVIKRDEKKNTAVASDSKATVEKASAEKATAEKATVAKASADCYYIIVTAGISFEHAQSVAEKLRKQGHRKAQAFNDEGKVRVAIASFGNYKEACKVLKEVRKEESRQSAWILYKK